MKILLVEDNRSLAEGLKRQLGRNYLIDAVTTGEEGLQRALSGGQDVIILDLSLPDKNGYDICRAVRQALVDTPIIILTGASDVTSRVTLLNAGADDYLTKPFSVAELRARLGALLRRPPVRSKPSVFNVQDLTLDPFQRKVERAGIVIDLRRKEFDILEVLVRNRGRPVSREQLLDHAWDGTKDIWNNTVDVHVKHLRDKVDRPFATPLIKTAYGIGYLIDDM